MLNEIQITKLIANGFNYVAVTKDGNDFIVSTIDANGWKEPRTYKEIERREFELRIKSLMFQPKTILELEDDCHIDVE